MAVVSRVLGDDFLEGLAEDLPGEDLDVFFNVAWLGGRKGHDESEEVAGFSSTFGYG